MSANNWTVCPKCMEKAIRKKEQLERQAKESYGNVTPEVYNRLRVQAQKNIELDETLREDYGFHIGNDGTFSASYRAYCDRCGFVYEFEHNETVTI